MKLKRLGLENFRQFHGYQELLFSTDPRHNVTLVYGSNGAGKTTILNAFTWGLYGETTPGLAEAEWLVNNLAWSEAEAGSETSARVVIEFEDEDNTYELERVQTARKGSDGERSIIREGEATLHITDEAGRNELGNPEGAVNAILPKRLHRFVFFDGERDIEHLAKPEAVAEIEDAIKTVLGLEVIERAIEHLKLARSRELNRELSEAGDERDRELASDIERLSAAIAELVEEQRQVKRNREAREKDRDAVDAQLAKLEESRELQRRRQDLEQAVSDAEQRIAQADRDLDAAVRRTGFLAFVPDLVAASDQLVATLYDKGEIPSAIKQQFVQALLERQECICGTSLPEGSKPHEAVAAWFDKAGRPEVEDRWISLGAHTKHFLTRRDDLYKYLRETLAEREGHDGERRLWDEKRSEIDDELRHVKSGAVQKLDERRKKLRDEIAADNRELGRLEEKGTDARAKLADTERELEEAQEAEQKADLARRRVRVAHEAEDVFKQILETRTNQTRSELDGRIKEVFGGMCFKPYVPSLTTDYRLTLAETVGGQEVPVAKSTGESQILSLSFVGAMAELARKRHQEAKEKEAAANLLSFQGGVFPLVLDAVFGALDDTYQREAASALPDLAPQVIVLVSRGQAPGAIHDELWQKTGRVAVCTLYTSAEDAESVEVETPAGKVPYRVPIKEPRDRSELVEA